MIKIQVMNRKQAEGIVFPIGVAVISIYTPGDSAARINAESGKVLTMCFPDIDKSMDQYRAFDMFDARGILDFILNKLFDDEGNVIESIVIHCDAGISRSAGVAVACNEILNSCKEVPEEWGLYNRHVYREIMTAYYRL